MSRDVAEQLRIHPSHRWDTVTVGVKPLMQAFRCGGCGCEPFMQNRATSEAAAECIPKSKARKPRPL